jgi:hypothetical protein
MSIPFLVTTALAAPAYGQTVGPAIPWARIVVAFLVCIAFAVGAILWLRSRQGLPTDVRTLLGQLRQSKASDPQAPLLIEQRLRASPTSQFVILRCGERRYLVHTGPQGAQNIDRLDDAPPASEPVS